MSSRTTNRIAAAITLMVFSFVESAGAQQTCGEAWQPGFGAPGLAGTVRALQSFEDGGGNALFAAGTSVHLPGESPANLVMRLRDGIWSPIATISGGQVNAMIAHDDGSSLALFVAGTITGVDGVAVNSIARWDGRVWTDLGGGLPGATILALATFDDGINGPSLCAAGSFVVPQGREVLQNIARWDGGAWHAVGGGIDGVVKDLAMFESGGISRLIAAGSISSAGGVPVQLIAAWDGEEWSSTGALFETDSPCAPPNPIVNALAVFNEGGVNRLYVGGDFTHVNGLEADDVARWDGTTWQGELNAGGPGSCDFSGDWNDYQTFVTALDTAHDGTGVRLFAAVMIPTFIAAPEDIQAIRRKTTSWSTIASLDEYDLSDSIGVNVLYGHTDENGPHLFAGGSSSWEQLTVGSGVTRYSDETWKPTGQGGADDTIRTVLGVNDAFGEGPALFAGGDFGYAGPAVAGRIAMFQGEAWSPLGSGVSGTSGGTLTVRALAFNESMQPSRLYAGGNFLNAGGVFAPYIAQWNGTTWSALSGNLNGEVLALLALPGALGGGVAVGGAFSGGIPALSRVGIWNGSQWVQLGPGLNNTVSSLAVFDEGTGPRLIAGGMFTAAGVVPINRVARWNGIAWSAMSTGFTQGNVVGLDVFNDGDGPSLYAAVNVTGPGSGPQNLVYRWTGSSWIALPHSGINQLRALRTVVSSEGQQQLFAAGFTNEYATVKRWSGDAWVGLDSGIDGLGVCDWDFASFDYDCYDLPTEAIGLAQFAPGMDEEPRLVVGGSFHSADGVPSRNLAIWTAFDVPFSITEQPVPQTIPVGATTTMHVEVSVAIDADYQWYRFNTPLQDGGNISGATTDTLTISPTLPSDQANYKVVVDAGPCGSLTSQFAFLDVLPLPDLTGDGDVEAADLGALLLQWGPCPPSGACSADLNHDHDVDGEDLGILLLGWTA